MFEWILAPALVVPVLAAFAIAAVVAAIPAAPRSLRASVAAGLASLAAVAALALPAGALAVGAEVPWQAIPVAFVAALSAIVQLFSVRQLRGELRQGWFAAGMNLLTAAVVATVASTTVLGFAVAWTLTGAALVALVRMYPGEPQTERATRHTLGALLVGDGALWTAVIVLLATGGPVLALADLGPLAAAMPGWQAATLALLVVVAGLARSAQVPFRRWLGTTLAAPTPVSAIMHAGVVNGAAFLVIGFAGLVSSAPVAMVVLLVAGSATMLVGIAGMIVRPDLKGRLVASTTAQMGFLVMTLGVGAFAVAVFHLMGHGLYKANLFLRAGSAIDDARAAAARSGSGAPTRRRWGVIAASALVGSAAVLAPTVLVAGAPTVSTVLLALYGCVTASAVLAAWMSRPDLALPARLAGVPVVAVAGSAFAVVAHAAEVALASGSAAAWAVPAAWLLVPLALAAALSALAATDLERYPRLHGLVLGLAGSPASRRVARARREPAAPVAVPVAAPARPQSRPHPVHTEEFA